MTNIQVKYEDCVVYSIQDNQQKHFNIQGQCDLDFWPSNAKINRGHLLVLANQHVKYEDSVMNGIQDNQQKPF